MIRTGVTFLTRDYPTITRRIQSNSDGYKETITNGYMLIDARF
jgi:hypothetical protein